MNILFAHDHKLRYINGKYYTLGGLSDKITKRYTDLFGYMTILCRAIPRQIYDKQIFEIGNPNVKINALHSSSLFFNLSDKKNIEQAVYNSDAVIIRIPSFISIEVYKYAKKHNKPILAEVVACPWDSYWNHGIKGKIIAPYMVIMLKKIVANADYVLYVTNEFLQHRYPTQSIQIGCSDVELNILNEDILKTRIEKINEFKGNLIIGTLAAVDTKYKGQQYVIKAISILKKKGFIVKYKLAGGGNQEFLKKLAKKYDVSELVEFDGVIAHNDVFKWIDTLDLYIQPSLQEGLPRALIEVMSRACPAVGFVTGGIPELINKDCLIQRKNVKAIASLLEKIDSDFLAQKAYENYIKSKEYQKETLDIKREIFYNQFKFFSDLKKHTYENHTN